MAVIDRILSKDEVFEDAPEEWMGQEDHKGIDNIHSKDNMASLLEGIELLVDKEHSAGLSSEEDRRKCAEEIKEMGQRIYSNRRGPRKAVLSPGAGFHNVLDSQSTPSRHNNKKAKGIERSERGPPRIQLEVPSRKLQSSGYKTPADGPSTGKHLLQTAPSKPKTRRELYGPAVLPTKKPAKEGRVSPPAHREVAKQNDGSSHMNDKATTYKMWRQKGKSCSESEDLRASPRSWNHEDCPGLDLTKGGDHNTGKVGQNKGMSPTSTYKKSHKSLLTPSLDKDPLRKQTRGQADPQRCSTKSGNDE